MPVLKRLWIHLTKPAWPLDEQFYGQNFVITELMKLHDEEEVHVVVNNYMPFYSMKAISRMDLLLSQQEFKLDHDYRKEFNSPTAVDPIQEIVDAVAHTLRGPGRSSLREFEAAYRQYLVSLQLLRRVQRLSNPPANLLAKATTEQRESKAGLFRAMLELEHVRGHMPLDKQEQCFASLEKDLGVDALECVGKEIARTLNISPDTFNDLLDLRYQPVLEMERIAQYRSELSSGRGVMYDRADKEAISDIVQSLIAEHGLLYEDEPAEVIVVFHYPKHAVRSAPELRKRTFTNRFGMPVFLRVVVYLHCLPDVQGFCHVNDVTALQQKKEELRKRAEALRDALLTLITHEEVARTLGCGTISEFLTRADRGEIMIKHYLQGQELQALQSLPGYDLDDSVWFCPLTHANTRDALRRIGQLIGTAQLQQKRGLLAPTVVVRLRGMHVAMLKFPLLRQAVALTGASAGAGFSELQQAIVLASAETTSQETILNLQATQTLEFAREAPKCVDEFIAVSEATKEAFVDYGLIRADMISTRLNTVDTRLYNPRNRRSSQKEFMEQFRIEPSLIVSYVGRMEHTKGYDVLIQLIPMLARFPGAAFCMVSTKGDRMQNLREDLERLHRTDPWVRRMITEGRLKLLLDVSKFAADLHEQHKTFTTSYFEHATSQEYAQFKSSPVRRIVEDNIIAFPMQCASDIYVQPSRSEAIGLGLLEARESEAYIVASDAGGMPEALQGHEHSIIPRSNDPYREARQYFEIIKDHAFAGLSGRVRRYFYNRREHEVGALVEDLVMQPPEVFRSLGEKVSKLKILEQVAHGDLSLRSLQNAEFVSSILKYWKKEFDERERRVIDSLQALHRLSPEDFEMVASLKFSA